MATTLEEWLSVVGKTYDDAGVQSLRARQDSPARGRGLRRTAMKPFPRQAST